MPDIVRTPLSSAVNDVCPFFLAPVDGILAFYEPVFDVLWYRFEYVIFRTVLM